MDWTGGAISGLFNYLGQRSANKANREEAARNRSFQERMRNTAWQAGLADMRAAGLNPALAYSQGPAASPGGSLAAPQQSELGGITEGVSSAMQLKREEQLHKEVLKMQRVNRLKMQADIGKVKADQELVELQSADARARFGFLHTPQIWGATNVQPAPTPFQEDWFARVRQLGASSSQLEALKNANEVQAALGLANRDLARMNIRRDRPVADLYERMGKFGAFLRTIGQPLFSGSAGAAIGRLSRR